MVISEISIQQRQDPMSKQSDLVLEEKKGDQLERIRVSFFKGLGPGYSEHCIISGREYAAELSRQEESCAV